MQILVFMRFVFGLWGFFFEVCDFVVFVGFNDIEVFWVVDFGYCDCYQFVVVFVGFYQFFEVEVGEYVIVDDQEVVVYVFFNVFECVIGFKGYWVVNEVNVFWIVGYFFVYEFFNFVVYVVD